MQCIKKGKKDIEVCISSLITELFTGYDPLKNNKTIDKSSKKVFNKYFQKYKLAPRTSKFQLRQILI